MFGDTQKEDLQNEIKDLEKQSASASGATAGAIRKNNQKKIDALTLQLEKLAVGGSILPGGAAIVGEGSMAGELVVNASSAAKVIPAAQTADLMAGIGGGGGQTIAPTIINSAPTSSTMVAASSSLNPVSQKYFRN